MSDLRLHLDTIEFADLAELGRSLIPTVAPGWTDHNVHDPGIMLMELMAWVADAQIYAVGRVSRGEREAYGRLLGLGLTGPQPARGLVWPLAADAPPGARPPWVAGTVVSPGTRVTGDRPQAPPFFTRHRIELTTAELTHVTTRFADGAATRDWTRANAQQGATFFPFGNQPRKGDTLVLAIEGVLKASAAADAAIAVGFEVAAAAPAGARPVPSADHSGACAPVRLRLSLRDEAGPRPVEVVEDTTAGLSSSGVLLLIVDPALAGVSGAFTLSIEPERGGFLLPPRLQRIALNVLPVEQVERVEEESPQFGTGLPDQAYRLKQPGLMHPLDDSFAVAVSNGGRVTSDWRRIEDLGASGPDDAVYAVEVSNGIVRFGNGINGRRPPRGATVQATYRATAGARGNLPPGIRWTVEGVPAPFGINREATWGGGAGRDLAALRAEARRHVRHARPIVTADDLQQAALALDGLEVARAYELPADARRRRLGGARVLVAVGQHSSRPGVGSFEESALWLGEIRRRLSPRLPLGQSLDVIGPRFVEVRVIAHLVAAPRLDPGGVRAEAEAVLRDRLAIAAVGGSDGWPFGRDVTALTVKGWLRNVPGVARVAGVQLRTPAEAEAVDRVRLGPTSLPRLRIEAGDITVESPSGDRA